MNAIHDWRSARESVCAAMLKNDILPELIPDYQDADVHGYWMFDSILPIGEDGYRPRVKASWPNESVMLEILPLMLDHASARDAYCQWRGEGD